MIFLQLGDAADPIRYQRAVDGEKKPTHEDRTHDAIRIERAYGAFERILAIPDDVEQDQICAQFRNGVLSIRLPRTASGPMPIRRIAITSQQAASRV